MKFIKLGEYKIGNIFCRKEKGKGGAAIFVKENLNFKAIDMSAFCIEGEIELAAVELADCKIKILTVYRPPRVILIFLYPH